MSRLPHIVSLKDHFGIFRPFKHFVIRWLVCKEIRRRIKGGIMTSKGIQISQSESESDRTLLQISFFHV